jgi:hypothetical protein
MLVLPPSIDLVLCFGKDGHIDISLNGCWEGVSPVPAGKRSYVYDAKHHDDCFDVIVVCSGNTKEVIRTDDKTFPNQFNLKKDPTNTPPLFLKPLVVSADAYLSPGNHDSLFVSFPSLHLVSLCTIVLLI